MRGTILSQDIHDERRRGICAAGGLLGPAGAIWSALRLLPSPPSLASLAVPLMPGR